MADYVKTSLLDDFEIPVITHETIKQQLIKVSQTHTVKQKQIPYANLPLEEKLKIIETEVYKTLGRYRGFVKVIYDAETLNKYIDKAISVDYLAFDTETNNSLDPLTCKVMGLCLYIPNTKPVYVPLNHCKPGTEELLPNQVTEEEAKQALMRLHEKNTKVVYHNGKFDIRVIYNTLGFYMPIWWDTMLAAQLLNENERAGLKIQYKKYIDPTIGSYNIEKLFSGVPYAWVDPEVFALYAAIDSYDTYQLQQYQEKIFTSKDMEKLYNLFLNIEVPVTLIVSKMEDVGISLDEDFNTRLNNKYHKGLDKAIADMDEILKPYQTLIHTYQLNKQLDEPLNFNSTPQLQTILYDILKIEPLEGNRATDASTLESLKHPFTEALLEYRHFTKLITAFTEALPALRSKRDNKIHASFNQMGKEENNVRTGRFSSTDPNLQQIPSKEKVMRLMFKASPGYVIIGGDYSQQEPRLLTHMCKDPKLIETYNNKKDLYATIASMVFKKDYWECMERWEDGTPNPTGKGIRSKAKGIVLGVMYGMGAKLMASILKVSVEECNQILKEFYDMFPTVKAFTEGNVKSATEHGYVEDYMGRRRHLPDINLPQVNIKAYRQEKIQNDIFSDVNLEDFIKVLDDKEIAYWTEEYEKACKVYKYDKKVEFKERARKAGVDVFDNGAFISKTMTQCTNARIQGSAATLTKKAMVEIYSDKRLMELGFRLLVPVHDELLGEAPAENAEECEKLLVEAMIRAGKPECSVNMKVDTYCVKHWYSDEVSFGIREAFLQYVNGNPKKNIEPISVEEAYQKMYNKYPELSQECVRAMCDDTFDHVNGKL